MNHRLALVTGSTGFIGAHLTKTLVEHGWRVRATVRQQSNTEQIDALGCDKVTVDFSSIESSPPSDGSRNNRSSTNSATEYLVNRVLADVTHVFHVAGRVAGTPSQLDRVNRSGTLGLLNAIRHATKASSSAPPALLLVSSAAAGGPSSRGQKRKPSDPPRPVSNYGRSKLAGEIEALRFSDHVPITIVRPGIVFGEGDREFIKLFQAMRRIYINPMIGLGTQPLGMIEVDDLVQLMIRAAESGRRCQPNSHSNGVGIYAASDPSAASLRHLGQIFRRTTGRWSLDLPLPPAIGWVVATAAEMISSSIGKPSTLNRDKIREARASGWDQDCSSALQQLGWQPQKTLDDRLAETLRKALTQGRL